MDLDDLERKVKFYEGRVLTNFDIHFNQLVLEDFYGGGYELRIEDEWFLEEYFNKYEDEIYYKIIPVDFDFNKCLSPKRIFFGHRLLPLGTFFQF